MDKVYTGIVILDEKMVDATNKAICEFLRHSDKYDHDEFEQCVKMYAKLLEVKESIHRERAKNI